ncbi:acylneuraminate cytidylyltransferase family protein [Pseudodesulfovibrio karagichevae]|uniref:Cytidylyltransferase domain-containing protein n=1 Tax=Pseudodesulfovibrio karagichevae TaxID=3239305 RepID=A0ABV4K0P9_9BACT
MRIGALVPARISSRRLLKKNILPLGGKPLIHWTLDALLASQSFDDITVSTESDEVADVVRQRYSEREVRILNRPASMAGSNSPLRDVVRHYLENRTGIDFMGLFMPTYPFRKPHKLVEACREISSRHILRVESVSEDEVCSHDYYHPCEGGFRRFLKGPASYFRYNSSCYVFFHRDFPEQAYLDSGYNINEKTYRLTLDWRENIDIDTREDMAAACEALTARERTLKPVVKTERDGWTLIAPKGLDADALFDHLGQERLADRDLPLLILETANPPFFMNRLGNSVSRFRYATEEAEHYLFSNKKIWATQNGQLIPTHYTQSRAMRLVSAPASGGPFGGSFNPDSLRDYDSPEETLIPRNRVLLLDDLKRLGLYVEPYEYGPAAEEAPAPERHLRVANGE